MREFNTNMKASLKILHKYQEIYSHGLLKEKHTQTTIKERIAQTQTVKGKTYRNYY